MYFHVDMNFITSGFKQISTAAQFQKELVQLDLPVMLQDGYVMAYVSNESDELNYVHFDDFAVTHSKTPIVQVDDYYPFGLTFNSFTRSYSEPQKYKYNGKEEQEEWGVIDYGARMYMADIGRWGVVDPLAEKFTDWSPYNYALNNPIRFIDPDGKKPLQGGKQQDPKKEQTPPVHVQRFRAMYQQGVENGKKLIEVRSELYKATESQGGIRGDTHTGKSEVINEVVKENTAVTEDGKVIVSFANHPDLKGQLKEAFGDKVQDEIKDKVGEKILEKVIPSLKGVSRSSNFVELMTSPLNAGITKKEAKRDAQLAYNKVLINLIQEAQKAQEAKEEKK